MSRFWKQSVALLALAAVVGLWCFSPSLAKPPGGGYTALVLDPKLPQTADSILALDVNDHNSVVGYTSTASNEHHALFWTVAGGKVTAFHLGSGAMANGVNNHDAAVGLRGGTDGTMAVYWPGPQVPPTDLLPPDGHVSSAARKINDHGFVVGGSRESGSMRDTPVAWRIIESGGQPVVSQPLVLGRLALDKDAWAEDVGQAEEVENGVYAARVCGTAYDSNDNERAVIWDVVSFVDAQGVPQMDVVSGPTDLGALPGDSESYGDAINKYGDVCGTPGFRKLFGQPIEPLLPPSSIQEPGFSHLGGINDKAEVVGTYYYGFGYSAPILWRADGSATNLDQFVGGTGWGSFNNPLAINNSGAIVGHGRRYSGGKRNAQLVNGAFILIPK